MTHYKRYAQYKPSNIDWLGDIPTHWEIRKLKFICYLQRGHDLAKENFKNGNIPVYGSNGVIGYHNEYTTIAPCITIGRSGSVGKINFISQNFWAHNTCLFIKNNLGNDWRYIYYLLTTIDFSMVSNGTAVPTLDRKNVHELYYALPPLPEQIAIAAYLDRKLSDIDTFIAKKQRLVTLLQEQKAAMINKAVTKGLNENKMRPSGIAWLGDIPAHWEIRKLKYVVSCNDEALSDKTDAKTLIQYVDIGNVDSLGNILEIATYMYKDAPSRARRITRQGDVIISTVRTYLKAIAEIKQNNLIVSTGFAVLRPNLKIISSPFLYLALQADYFIHKVNANSVGVGYPAINASELVKLKIPVPPLSEQIAIVSHIETESARIDKAISLVERELTLVQEYRTALIAEAVTGKYDCTP